jgi:hypothetical protein
MKHRKSLIHLTGRKKYSFLIKNCGIMKACKTRHFFLIFFYINFSRVSGFFQKPGGEIVVWSRGSRLASGKYHEDLGLVASFWRQQTWKSVVFLASLAWLKRDRSRPPPVIYSIAQWLQHVARTLINFHQNLNQLNTDESELDITKRNKNSHELHSKFEPAQSWRELTRVHESWR